MSLENLIEVNIDQSKFLIIKETLSRIGISSKDNSTLYQTCHILHKGGKYYIVHYKQMFELDGKVSTFSDEDRKRRNTIANLLEDWKLLEIVNPKQTDDELSMRTIKIVPAKDKSKWTFVTKYTIGKKSKKVLDD